MLLEIRSRERSRVGNGSVFDVPENGSLPIPDRYLQIRPIQKKISSDQESSVGHSGDAVDAARQMMAPAPDSPA